MFETKRYYIDDILKGTVEVKIERNSTSFTRV